jgi:hypothetical protein
MAALPWEFDDTPIQRAIKPPSTMMGWPVM